MASSTTSLPPTSVWHKIRPHGGHDLVSVATVQDDLFATRAMLLAGFTILLYDHILTFAHEVRGVWKAKRGVVKVIFLLNRYIVPLMLLVDIYEQFFMPSGDPVGIMKFCKYWTTVQSYLTIASFASLHALVALRVYALHGGKQSIGFLLWACGVLYLLVCMAILTAGLISLIPSSSHMRSEHGCVGSIPSWLWTLWLPTLFFEAFLFYLTFKSAMIQCSSDGGFHPVALILYRDGVLYFLAMTFCSLFSLIVWATAGPSLIGLARYFALAVVNVVGARMVLNLRVYAVEKREATEAREAEVEKASRTSATPRSSEWSNLATPDSSMPFNFLSYAQPPATGTVPEHMAMKSSEAKSYHYVKRSRWSGSAGAHGRSGQHALNWVRGLSTGRVDEQMQSFTTSSRDRERERARAANANVRSARKESMDPREFALRQFYGHGMGGPVASRGYPQDRSTSSTITANYVPSKRHSPRQSRLDAGPVVLSPRPRPPEDHHLRPSAPEPITPQTASFRSHSPGQTSYLSDYPAPPRSNATTSRTIPRKPAPSLLGVDVDVHSSSPSQSPHPTSTRQEHARIRVEEDDDEEGRRRRRDSTPSVISSTDTFIGETADADDRQSTSMFTYTRPGVGTSSTWSGARAV